MRVRIRYGVEGKVRFLSHRDVARVMERAIRRAAVPVAYTEGFSPRPKVQYGLALSTGYESDGEYIDIYLDPDGQGVRDPRDRAGADGVPAGRSRGAGGGRGATSGHEPAGFRGVHAVARAPRCHRGGAMGGLAQQVDELLASESYEIDIIRKGKPVSEDLRPLVHALRVTAPSGGGPAVLEAELGTKPRSIRPSELLGALGVSEPRLVRRTHQWTRRDGDRREPLALGDLSPRAEACAP